MSMLPQAYLSSSFLLCPVLSSLPIVRDRASKWFVSQAEIERDQHSFPGNMTELYPTVCTGWIYILTPATAARLVRALPFPHFCLIFVG